MKLHFVLCKNCGWIFTPNFNSEDTVSSIKALRKPLKILFLILPSFWVLLQIPTFSILKTYYNFHFVDSYYTVFLRVCKTHSKYHLLFCESNKFTESMFILSISEAPQKDPEHPSPCINSCFSFQLVKTPKSSSVCFQPFQTNFCCF